MGGVFMNLILAILIFCGVYYKTGIPKDLGKVKVEEIVSGSPAEEAGIKTGDVVVSVGGVSVKKSKELIEEVDKFKGSSANLGIERDGKFKEVEVMVREDPPEGEGSMGVVITDTRIEKYPWWQMYKGIGPGFEEAYFWAKVILDGLGQMITGVFTGKIPKDVAGPVGMYQATASVRKETGLLGVLHFFGIVSVNLAVVNLLPFPALDGGRLVFVLIEKIRGKRVNEKIEATANAIGMSLLLGLIVLITIGDIVRLLK